MPLLVDFNYDVFGRITVRANGIFSARLASYGNAIAVAVFAVYGVSSWG